MSGAWMERLIIAARRRTSGSGLEAYPTGLKAVRALKRKYSAYAGPCIRVRRSSDGAEQDIGFVTADVDAAVDSAAALSFASAGDAFVTTIYDQSGNGDDWVQTTAGKQPRVIESGLWEGFVRFDGADDSMQSTSLSGAVAAYNAVVVLALRSGGGSGRVILDRGVNLGGNSNNETAVGTGTINSVASITVFKSEGMNYLGTGFDITTKAPDGIHANWATMTYQVSGAASLEWWQGSTKYSPDGTASVGGVSTGILGTPSKWYLGARNNSLFFCDLNWSADAIYEGDVSDADKAAIQAILER